MSKTERRIFQAGYVAGENSWSVVGRGLSAADARKDLERAIHIRALEFVAEQAQLRAPAKIPAGFLEKMYSEWTEFLKSSRYVESDYVDNRREGIDP